MTTVFITNDLSRIAINPYLIDYAYPDLFSFTNDIIY